MILKTIAEWMNDQYEFHRFTYEQCELHTMPQQVRKNSTKCIHVNLPHSLLR